MVRWRVSACIAPTQSGATWRLAICAFVAGGAGPVEGDDLEVAGGPGSLEHQGAHGGGVGAELTGGGDDERALQRRVEVGLTGGHGVPVDAALVLVAVQDEVEAVVTQSLADQTEVHQRLIRLAFLAGRERQQLVVDDGDADAFWVLGARQRLGDRGEVLGERLDLPARDARDVMLAQLSELAEDLLAGRVLERLEGGGPLVEVPRAAGLDVGAAPIAGVQRDDEHVVGGDNVGVAGGRGPQLAGLRVEVDAVQQRGHTALGARGAQERLVAFRGAGGGAPDDVVVAGDDEDPGRFVTEDVGAVGQQLDELRETLRAPLVGQVAADDHRAGQAVFLDEMLEPPERAQEDALGGLAVGLARQLDLVVVLVLAGGDVAKVRVRRVQQPRGHGAGGSSRASASSAR